MPSLIWMVSQSKYHRSHGHPVEILEDPGYAQVDASFENTIECDHDLLRHVQLKQNRCI